MRRLRSPRVRTRPKPPKRPSERCRAWSRYARTKDNYPRETRFSSRCLRGLWFTELPSWPQPSVSRLTPGLGFLSLPTSSLTNRYRLLRRLSQSEARTRNREIWVNLQHVPRVFTPVLAKHSKSFSLIDCISVGVGRMQRNFDPMRKQVEVWQRFELTD